MTDFNEQLLNALTLNFSELIQNSDYVKSSELEAYKQGLISAGYRFISVSSNMGFTLMTLFYATKLFFVSSNIILFFAKTKTRCRQLRLGSRCMRITENISTPSYFNFEMSSSIVQLTSAFVYLRFSKSYASKFSISETTLPQ